MRVLSSKFFTNEDGASLVEYAVALIVVTIIGGAGVIALGQNAGGVTEAACDVTQDAFDIASELEGVEITSEGGDCVGGGGE
ncbi:MAG: hypothetical protein AAGK71_06960 [Pseudomonadota bacterium]